MPSYTIRKKQRPAFRNSMPIIRRGITSYSRSESILCIAMWFLYVCSPFGATAQSKDTHPFRPKAEERPFVIAHGGSKWLFPENTMEAFDGSDSIGIDILEMDVCLTKDNKLVTHHDETLRRTSNGTGYICEYTVEELKQFNFGYNFKGLKKDYPYRRQHVEIALLEDVLQKYGTKHCLFIEIKGNKTSALKAAGELNRLLKKYRLEKQVVVSSFDDKVMRAFRKYSGGQVITTMAKRNTTLFYLLCRLRLGFLWRGKDKALQIPVKRGKIKLDKEWIIRAAHAKNIAVCYWSINNTEDMARLIRLGADGIITDRPDILNEWLTHKYGLQKNQLHK